MATILTKKKDTTGAPSAGDLTNSTGGAELAVNTADKRLYTKDSGGNVVEVGINPTSITTGTLNTSGAVVFNDAGADVDFRVESDTNENALFVEGSSGNVGIGTSSPLMGLQLASSTGNALYGGLDGNPNSFLIRNNLYYDDSNARAQPIANGFQTQIEMRNQDGSIRFSTSTSSNNVGDASTITERMRITSGGYFKASNTGSYWASTGTNHEASNSVSDNAAFLSYASNGSYANNVLVSVAARSANSAYSLLKCYSLGAGDIEFNLRGDGNAYADGSWNGSGADYAEYFESATGEAIPRGTTVVLENNKVRAATADDPTSSIIGVVRPKEFGKGSMVVGNLAWNMWTDKYITDDFGVYEMEDHDIVEWEETITDEDGNTSTKPYSYESWNIPEGVTVPADATRKTHDEKGKKFQHRKLNPNYDPAVEYTPREERPEWLIIGLLGQVPVLKGQPVGDRWVKMRDISETVEEWMIR